MGVAEAVAHYFQTIPDDPNKKASAHRCYDPETVVQCVEDKDVAYGAPGANGIGLQFELPGYSANNDWSDLDVEAAMRLCAMDTTEAAAKYQFPLEWRTAADLLAGKTWGITTHNEVTKAYHQSNHTDPGPFFPVGRFLEMCKAAPPANQVPGSPSGLFIGDLMNVVPSARMGSVPAPACKTATQGFYEVTADGGVRAFFAPFYGGYLNLPVENRQGDRQFLSISPNEDNSAGYTIWANDGSGYEFGPGKNGF